MDRKLCSEIKRRIDEGEATGRKVVSFLLQALIHADTLKSEKGREVCKELGMKPSFATEFCKMRTMSQLMKEEGLIISRSL